MLWKERTPLAGGLLLIILVLTTPFVARAQLPFFLRITRQPATSTPASQGIGAADVEAEIGKEVVAPVNPELLDGAPWIVYSDRPNNNTFRHPNGLAKFRKMEFMEAFYVIKEKDGYVKIVKYDPELPVGNRFSKRIITDRSKTKYYGWAPKSRFLLTNQSIRSADQRRAELVSGTVSSPKLFANPEQFLSNDSVRLFADPGQQIPLAQSMPLYELAFIYKRSESGRDVLIGRAPSFGIDRVKQTILGWVSNDVLQSVGQRLFIEADTVSPVTRQTLLYKTVSAAIANKKDSALLLSQFPAVSWTGFGYKFPVINLCCAQDSQIVVQTQAPTPFYISRKVPVISVSGRRLTSAGLANIRRNSSRYNLVFVVEESLAMKPYWDELKNAVQFTITQRLRDTIPNVSLKVGAVLYHGTEKHPQVRKSDINCLNLTSDYTLLSNFLETNTPPTGQAYAGPQPMRHGILNALKLVANRPDENNIILIIGMTGDDQNVSDWDDVSNALQKTPCRMLSFQTYAFDELVANDFVLQSKELILKTGQLGSLLKQDKLVDPTLMTLGTAFDLRLGDRNVYQLAYPLRSMVPGWVLFPRKKQPLLFKELVAATDSLFRQVFDENNKILNAISVASRQVESMTKTINPALTVATGKTEVTTNFSDLLNRVGVKYPYLVPAYMRVPNRQEPAIKYVALLTADDYDDMGKWLDRLSGDNVDPTYYVDRLRLKNYVRSVLREAGLASENISTLGQLLHRISDLPVSNPLFCQVDIRHLDDPDKVSDTVLLQALYLLRERRDYFRRIPAFRNSRFQSNGQTYYWVSEDLFK